MLKASALFYSIIVALIIALISCSLILFSYYNRLQFQSLQLQEQTILNSTSGINILLANSAFLSLNEQRIIDLYGNETDSVQLMRKHWGAFEIIVSRAFFKGFEVTKSAQVGADINSDAQTALYLADQDKPLSLCGKTIINGICYLPKAGVKRAYIEGQSFTGDQLINGKINESSKSLPEINKDLLESNLGYFLNKYDEKDSIIYIDDHELGDSIIHAFIHNTILLYSINKINLKNKYYRGNLRIVSAHSVFIPADAQIQDVLIYAPFVEIEEGFSGNIQIFATDSIHIGKKCSLNYPSVIALIRTDKSPENIEVSIGEETNFKGVILGYQENTNNKKQLRLVINKDAIIHGQVYANGHVELKGKIQGSLTCTKFILSTPSSVYENHLLNATIDRSGLSSHFVGVSLIHHSQSKRIVKWLY
ncbi:MAG: hypothetical protein M3Q58_12620 [Bacteroidota bacterium]|nr:hypothetical protein [Bacteroidota bacterium]